MAAAASARPRHAAPAAGHDQPVNARTTRARQLSTDQPAVDIIDIRLYRDHSASERYRTALPQARPKRQLEGRSHTDIVTVTAPTEKINT